MASGKSGVDDLALFGGEPCFPQPLHVGRPNIGDRGRLRELIGSAFDRRWLTNDGPYVPEFEQLVADRLGVQHVVATCNGTAALQIAARATGLSGEVIVPSFTFVATPHALSWLGLEPVFCDVEPGSYTLDPDAVERLITPATSAILGVHLWGTPCDVRALEELAQRHGLTLLFDGAQAFGTSFAGRSIANFGEAEILSFHATKIVNAIEGGALVTNDAGLAERARLMRSYGFAAADTVVSIGTNAKMNEISAATGITSLEALDSFVETNRNNYTAYERQLRGVPGVAIRDADLGGNPTFHNVVVEVDPSSSGMTRDLLQAALHAENVLARRYFYPGCHRMEPYASLFPEVAERLPVTEHAVTRTISLPTGQGMDRRAIEQLCDLVRFVVDHATEVGSRSMSRAAPPA
jgi:dTDP-4-amino-4,6-dideoxygalactose transaminase